ncbi:MAG: TonB-dependent receptor, partial [Bacteroidetes bacterium]|nr:TonB-dependent receptor [Bacteroidota bacterium]
MKKTFLLSLLFLIGFDAVGQISGVVTDKSDGTPLLNVKIYASNGQRTLTDVQGNFQITASSYPVTLIFSLLEYKTDTLLIAAAGTYPLAMRVNEKTEQTVVVSANKRAQAIEEIPISLEVIKPRLIENKGMVNLEQAVEQTPGVFTMDGQVSIRGGAGFAYGAGSRVMMLWNGMPLLSGYVGDVQWNAIPIEQASQVEVIKGASSVLYGSGALNGVIALSEKEPGLVPETKIRVQAGIYDNPRRKSMQWWGKDSAQRFNPMNQQVEVFRSQMFKRTGYTISTVFYNDQGFRQGETETRGRISGTLYLRPVKNERLKAGVGLNYQFQKTGTFIIWQSDALGYTPSGGADTANPASTLTYNIANRLFIDPYIKYIDRFKNKHTFKSRAYLTTNQNINNSQQSNGAIVYTGDYGFQHNFTTGGTLISGAFYSYNVVFSNLFGDHVSSNAAVYTQFEQHFGKFDLTAGMRAEYFTMDKKRGDSDFKLGAVTLPFYPVFRAGAHYELKKYTHLRASVGQGIRYPSVGERFTSTSVGALNIFPNPNLIPETGWAAELGIKQGVKMGDWKGMIDLAGFINNYSNMIEFSFGFYNPQNGNFIDIYTPEGQAELSYIQQTYGYTIQQIIGFGAQNVEKARITGVELSFNSMGKIGDVEVVSLIGYTNMNPVSLNADPKYTIYNSDSTNILKYRFRHLVRADIEAVYKKWGFGLSNRYNSYMRNIDKVFEDAIAVNTFILPGLKEYRQVYNKGNITFDARISYQCTEKLKASFIANNVFNTETTSRPGDIQ